MEFNAKKGGMMNGILVDGRKERSEWEVPSKTDARE